MRDSVCSTPELFISSLFSTKSFCLHHSSLVEGSKPVITHSPVWALPSKSLAAGGCNLLVSLLEGLVDRIDWSPGREWSSQFWMIQGNGNITINVESAFKVIESNRKSCVALRNHWHQIHSLEKPLHCSFLLLKHVKGMVYPLQWRAGMASVVGLAYG